MNISPLGCVLCAPTECGRQFYRFSQDLFRWLLLASLSCSHVLSGPHSKLFILSVHPTLNVLSLDLCINPFCLIWASPGEAFPFHSSAWLASICCFLFSFILDLQENRGLCSHVNSLSFEYEQCLALQSHRKHLSDEWIRFSVRWAPIIHGSQKLAV